MCKICGLQSIKITQNNFFIEMMCLFYLWCFNVEYILCIFKLNPCIYCDVICLKLCDFCILNMNIHICHWKKMSHLFEYLKYWIHTNIIHINYNIKLMWFLHEPMKTLFHIKLLEWTMKPINFRDVKLGIYIISLICMSSSNIFGRINEVFPILLTLS